MPCPLRSIVNVVSPLVALIVQPWVLWVWSPTWFGPRVPRERSDRGHRQRRGWDGACHVGAGTPSN